ncbi:hypothetical protein LOAG_05697 [Loa loa]|uniref:Uncharacterized protein n=1 Tax=Loa loa TaxID=7209 RepID=A0A1S0TZC5_LOALO|nr:hypothetical protein LOAG_05697 [Loa loa]EFO22787.1 hypothetical protein LOAG_05697 [Loa loa]
MCDNGDLQQEPKRKTRQDHSFELLKIHNYYDKAIAWNGLELNDKEFLSSFWCMLHDSDADPICFTEERRAEQSGGTEKTRTGRSAKCKTEGLSSCFSQHYFNYQKMLHGFPQTTKITNSF